MAAIVLMGGKANLKRRVFPPARSRMAQAGLKCLLEAAAAAGVSRRTVLRFERYHRDVRPELVEALGRAYEAAGCASSMRGRTPGV